MNIIKIRVIARLVKLVQGVNLSVQVSLHSHLSKLSTGRSLLNLACGQIKENTNG